ncbi:MAG: class I adenylate-forming enzyme family protein [Desulfobacterales bacterium]
MADITEMTEQQRQQAVEDMTLPGGPFEVITENIRGVEYTVFKAAPRTLKEVYALGMDKESLISRAITGWFGEKEWPFMVYQEERYTFRETYEQAARLAWRIQEQFGIEKGDRVAIAMRNYPEFCLAFMAATALGALAVPLNAWWEGPELLYGLEHSGPKLIFADQQRADRVAPYLDELAIRMVVARADGDIADGAIHLDALMEGSDETEFPDVDVDTDDDAYIMYTSGSTGHPKGVVATHRAVTNTLLCWEYGTLGGLHLNKAHLHEMNPEFKGSGLLTVPLFHATGLISQFLGSFRMKRKMVMMYKWDPEEALRLIEKERITQFNGVPTMSWEMVNSPNFSTTDTRSLNVLGGGGAARPPEQVRQMEKQVGRHIAQAGYGMTETTAIGTGNGGESYAAKPDSVGKATFPLVQVKIVDTDGNALPAGDMGEICFKTVANLRCYWSDPKATKDIYLADGWIRSGDIGVMDDEDFVYIKDRAKDMIIRGGENIACREIEDAIYEHPSVFEAAVFSMPEERLGEQVSAVVMVREGEVLSEKELQDFLGHRLAKYKIPSLIWLQRESLLRGGTGKIFKKQIREDKLLELENR